MIIEFPTGHPYDFERLCAGVTALLGREATHKSPLTYTWGISGDSPTPKLNFPPGAVQTVMTSAVTSAVYATAVKFTASAGTGISVQARIHKESDCVSVFISAGFLDPICEVIGFWRYGDPGVRKSFGLE